MRRTSGPPGEWVCSQTAEVSLCRTRGQKNLARLSAGVRDGRWRVAPLPGSVWCAARAAPRTSHVQLGAPEKARSPCARPVLVAWWQVDLCAWCVRRARRFRRHACRMCEGPPRNLSSLCCPRQTRGSAALCARQMRCRVQTAGAKQKLFLLLQVCAAGLGIQTFCGPYYCCPRSGAQPDGRLGRVQQAKCVQF